jgi:hypothetical protein
MLTKARLDDEDELAVEVDVEQDLANGSDAEEEELFETVFEMF